MRYNRLVPSFDNTHGTGQVAFIDRYISNSVTVSQIINGSHHNRAIEAHMVTLQVLFDLWFGEFLKTRLPVLYALQSRIVKLATAQQLGEGIREAHNDVLILIKELDLEKKLAEFDKDHAGFPMFKLARMCMRQVIASQNFNRSNKQSNLFMFLSSLENLCKYFFSYNRLDYLQNIIEFIARTYDCKQKDPDIWNIFVAGEFAMKRNHVPFTGTGVDQGQEFLNKVLKGDGGIRGLTTKPATLLKYCLSTPVLSELAKETDTMISGQ